MQRQSLEFELVLHFHQQSVETSLLFGGIQKNLQIKSSYIRFTTITALQFPCTSFTSNKFDRKPTTTSCSIDELKKAVSNNDNLIRSIVEKTSPKRETKFRNLSLTFDSSSKYRPVINLFIIF